MALLDVANTIKTIEGWFKTGTVSQRLNNPGNLMYAGQAGATPHPIYDADGKLVGTFAEFSSPDAGEAALQRQIQLDASRGLSIQDFANKYAPSGHGTNDPNAYAQQIAAATGLSVNDPLSAAIADPSVLSSGTSPIDQLEASLDGTGETDLTTVAVVVGASLLGALLLSKIV